MNAESLLPFRNLTLQQWALIVGILVALFSAGMTGLTLYYSFLKRAKLSLRIGKSGMLVFHDMALDLCPMIDVFCTLVNAGARSKVVDRLIVHFKHKGSAQRFYDYGFLRLKDGKEWALEDFSHPLVVNKYSEVSRMVMFKSEQPTYPFENGPYTLTIEARTAERRVGVDSADFVITPAKVEEIQKKKEAKRNEATEISLV